MTGVLHTTLRGNRQPVTNTTPIRSLRAEAESLMKTLRTEAVRPVSTTNQNACLIHIYPTGPKMGVRYPLGEYPLILGRDTECGLCIPDNSVSRRHARIHPRSDGYYTEDLGSTNGTYINDVAAVMTKLKDGDYLRVGSCIYRFLMGGNVEADYHAVIYKLTIVDALTDIHNKRFMLEFLERELVRSGRYHRPLSLLMFDIDHFKQVNDTLGHLGGDYVLRELAARIKPLIRSDELFARYGGEEFAVVQPEAMAKARSWSANGCDASSRISRSTMKKCRCRRRSVSAWRRRSATNT